MEKQKVCGSTADLAEIVVDYRKGKTEILGTPTENLYNRLKSAFYDWFVNTFLLFCFIIAILVGVFKIDMNFLVCLWGAVMLILVSLHLDKKRDKKLKRFFALRTARDGKKNKVTITDFKHDDFVLYNFKNVALDFKTSGDVKKQLNKIWIREQHPSSMISSQATLKNMLFKENDPVWNAYFHFNRTPKNGELRLEWI